MQAISLIYHDVIEDADHEASGFPWPDAALYKLGPAQFDEHLRAIAGAATEKPVTIQAMTSEAGGQRPLLLTFDDGGVSAYTHIAGRLEAMGWRGHFFIAAGYIGTSAFVSPEQIRELRCRGHVIGSHSYSHPLRMAKCSWEELMREWRMSTEILSEILGERITVASIPGGQYARKVAAAAASAGIEMLFTSEPRMKCREVDGCLVLGRFSIQRWTSPQTAAAFASGRLAPRFRQRLFWDAKKIAKKVGGEYYLKARAALIGDN